MTFQMAAFLQVNWWLSQSETLHHLLLGWSAVIADIWCRYHIVTSGKTTWTYADSGQPSGFLDSQIRKIFQVKICDQSEHFIGFWGHKKHHYLGIIWSSIIKWTLNFLFLFISLRFFILTIGDPFAMIWIFIKKWSPIFQSGSDCTLLLKSISLLMTHLESAYSSIYGVYKIWRQGGGRLLALLWQVYLF